MGNVISMPAATGHRSFDPNAQARPMDAVRVLQTFAAENGSTFSLADLDVSDPASLHAFFSDQVSKAKDHLTTIISAQTKRNEAMRSLQTASAKFAQWSESGVPADKVGEFLAAGKELLAAMPAGSKEAETIRSILGPVEAGKEVIEPQVDKTSADLWAAVRAEEGKGGRVVESIGADGQRTYAVHSRDLVLPTADQVKTIVASTKALTDSMQSDVAMEMIRVQTGVERMSQLTQTCSNILKKDADKTNTIVANFR